LAKKYAVGLTSILDREQYVFTFQTIRITPNHVDSSMAIGKEFDVLDN